jgi:hypothetical protein
MFCVHTICKSMYVTTVPFLTLWFSTKNRYVPQVSAPRVAECRRTTRLQVSAARLASDSTIARGAVQCGAVHFHSHVLGCTQRIRRLHEKTLAKYDVCLDQFLYRSLFYVAVNECLIIAVHFVVQIVNEQWVKEVCYIYSKLLFLLYLSKKSDVKIMAVLFRTYNVKTTSSR